MQKFNSEGKYLKMIGRGKGDEKGFFMQPRSVSIDSKTSCIIVVDTALHRVQVRLNHTIRCILKLTIKPMLFIINYWHRRIHFH